MEKLVNVKYNHRTYHYEESTSLYDISKDFQKYYNYPILLARTDNDLRELHEPIGKSCTLQFYDRSSEIGHNIYMSSVDFVLILAAKRVLGKDVEIKIEHSIDKGVYCEITNRNIDKSTVRKIEKEMKDIQEQDILFKKLSVDRIDAINYYRRNDQLDKVNSLKYISNSYINLYRLDDTYDYFYSDMAYSTRQIDEFKLTFIKDGGFVLSYPTVSNPEITLDYVHHKKLFDKFLEYTRWGRALGIETSADLNKAVSLDKSNEIIRIGEINYDSQILEIANNIYNDRERIKLVLIAGPSSSGKTTTARKL